MVSATNIAFAETSLGGTPVTPPTDEAVVDAEQLPAWTLGNSSSSTIAAADAISARFYSQRRAGDDATFMRYRLNF